MEACRVTIHAQMKPLYKQSFQWNSSINLTALNKTKFDTDFVSIHSLSIWHYGEAKG